MVTDIESQSSFDLFIFIFHFSGMEFLFLTKNQVYPIAIWIEIQFTQCQEKKTNLDHFKAQ
jgi:hypothetical protein